MLIKKTWEVAWLFERMVEDVEMEFGRGEYWTYIYILLVNIQLPTWPLELVLMVIEDCP